MTALVQVPDMQLVPVLASYQQLWNDAVFHHIRGAPFRGDHRVVSQVPPEIVGELLRTAILFPWPLQLERIRIHQENSAGSISIRRTERAPIDTVRTTVDGVRGGIAGFLDELLRLNHLHNLRL